MRYGDDDRARKRPGIINPDMEERFFYSILSTFKIRKADQLKSNHQSIFKFSRKSAGGC